MALPTAFEQLVQSLRLLALDPGAQREEIPLGAAFADELALSFDDAFRRYSFSEKEGVSFFELLEELDTLFAMASDCDNQAVWSDQAVFQGPFWRTIRRLAQNALEETEC